MERLMLMHLILKSTCWPSFAFTFSLLGVLSLGLYPNIYIRASLTHTVSLKECMAGLTTLLLVICLHITQWLHVA